MTELIKDGILIRQLYMAVGAIIIGVLITLLANYISTLCNEKLKLKAKLANNRIDTVEELLKLSVELHTMTIFKDKTEEDIGFDIRLDETEKNPLRGPYLVVSEQDYIDFRMKFNEIIQGKEYMLNKEIVKTGAYLQDYFVNLDLIKQKFPVDKNWILAVAVKSDFQKLSGELSNTLQKYLLGGVYKFSRTPIKWKKYKKRETLNRLNNTYLYSFIFSIIISNFPKFNVFNPPIRDKKSAGGSKSRPAKQIFIFPPCRPAGHWIQRHAGSKEQWTWAIFQRPPVHSRYIVARTAGTGKLLYLVKKQRHAESVL